MAQIIDCRTLARHKLENIASNAEFFSATKKEAVHRFSGASCLLFCFLFRLLLGFFFCLLIFL